MLLFLYQDVPLAEYPDGYVWNTSLLGGTVLLAGGEAFLTDYQAREGAQRLGTADGVIRRVAAMLGTGPSETEAALEAANKPSKPLPEPGSPILVMAALLSSGVAVGLGLAYLRHRLGNS